MSPETKTLVRFGAWFEPRTPVRDYEFARGANLEVTYAGRILFDGPLYTLGVTLPETVPPTLPPALLVPVTDVDPKKVQVVLDVPVGVWRPRDVRVQLVFSDGTTELVPVTRVRRTQGRWMR